MDGKSQSSSPGMLQAVLWTPWSRRKQTLAVALWLYAPIVSILVCMFMLFYAFFTWPLILVYCLWLVYSLRMPFSGSALKSGQRTFNFWRHFRDYFPVSFELADPQSKGSFSSDNQYMFGYHPHGIFGFGALCTFAMDREGGMYEIVPALRKIKLHLLTVDVNFYIPLWREMCLAIGLAGVGRQSVQGLLENGGSVAIVVGGAREALDSIPGTTDLVLRKRKGFFRLALQHGCSVVPVFGFGENETYRVMGRKPGSWLYRLQNKLIHIFGFTLPLFNGRGMFNYSRGLLPRRHPIHVVMGRPIPAKHTPHPTDKEINELQAEYITELQSLFDEFKDKYAAGRKRDLRIIE